MDERTIDQWLELAGAAAPDEQAECERRLAGDPQLQARRARIVRQDAAIRQAIDDLSVPAGLADRLKAAAARATAVEVAPPVEPRAAVAGGVARRRLGAAVAVAAAATLLVAVGLAWWNRAPSVESAERVAARALTHWVAAVDAGRWNEVSAGVLASHPIDPALNFHPHHWQRADTVTGGHEGVVYRGIAPGAAAPTLTFVLAGGDPAALPSRPPRAALHSTGGWRASAWQRDSRLYVLAVHGTERDYGRLIDPHSGQLALATPRAGHGKLAHARGRAVAWNGLPDR